MQEIELGAIQNYQENMEFFKNTQPALHNRLLALDTILNDGTYPQKYDLEYKDGYFDVLDIGSKTYLYNQDSLKSSEMITSQVTYKKNDQTFKTHRKLHFEKETLQIFKASSAYSNYVSVAEIMDYCSKNTDDSMNMTNISKFIFIGTGLGIHIEKIVEKFRIPIVLIIEKDIELFRLSMFTTNYSKIFNGRKAFFSIAQNKNEFHTTFNNFFLQAFFKNQYLKFHAFSEAYANVIEDIRSLLISRPEATYSNERMLVKNKLLIESINKHYKYIDLRKKSDENFFTDKPWIVVGAGPSLQNNAKWLKENQNKFIIIAAFTALKTLQKLGISPDIAVQIHEDPKTTKKMLENLDDLSFLDKTMMFFSGSVSKEMFESFDKKKIYLHEDRTKYKLDKSLLAVTSVGETIYSIALIFNAPDIYLLGLDLSVNEDKKSYAKDHFLAQEFDDKVQRTNDNIEKDFQLHENLLKVKGNFKKEVLTTPLLALSIPVVNYKTKAYKSDNQTIYNLNDGAYFENTVPTRVNEIKKYDDIKKDKLYKELEDIFNKYSSDSLDKDEITELETRHKQIDDYYKLIEGFKNSPHSNKDIFLDNYETFVSSMFNHPIKLELQEMLVIYFLRITSFIDDFLHTREIDNPKKHIKKLKSLLINQITMMVKTYERDLKLLK
jgi:hypothetical protein